VISVVDPDARHTRKSPEARRDGYRAHVAAEPETGIITDEKLTKASGEDNSDPAVAAEFLAAAHASQDAGFDAGPGRVEPSGDPDARQPLSWYADSAYGSGELREAIGQAGDTAVIKPKPLQPAVEGGFTLDDYTVNEENAPSPARMGSPGESPPAATSPSELPAAVARSASAAPPPRRDAASSCTNTTTCCVPPVATGPDCARIT
jgi:hypothetical protein